MHSTPDPGPLRDVRELRIALVGEVRGEIQPCGCPTVPYGGFARRERLLVDVAGEGFPLFHLDAGEALLKGVSQAGRDRQEIRVKTVLSLMREVGVDLLVPGPTDLLAQNLAGLKAISAQGPPLVSATWLDDKGAPVFPVSRVLERDGIRLGVVGLSARPEAPETQALVQWRDPVSAAQGAVAALPQGLDLVVAVSNLAQADALRVAREVPGLAAVLSTRGSEHDAPQATTGAPVIETPSRGRYVTVLRMRLASTGSQDLVFDGPLVDKLSVLHDLRPGAAGNLPKSAQVRGKRDEVAAELQVGAAGQNLVVVEDRPLGAALDGETRSAQWISGFLDQVEERAVAMAAVEDSGPAYATTASCISCHMHQFSTWAFSGHKNAWNVLVEREEAFNPECLECHATGFGEPGGFGELTRFNLNRLGAVQCEACHGPLAGHPEDGEVVPRGVTVDTCLACHDEANSPEFDAERYWNSAACTPDPRRSGLPGGQ